MRKSIYAYFQDINKACPIDDFSIPYTDLMVDDTRGYEALTFIDGYSEYSKTKMHQNEEEMTASVTKRSLLL